MPLLSSLLIGEIPACTGLAPDEDAGMTLKKSL
jgi:hypothetical protein